MDICYQTLVAYPLAIFYTQLLLQNCSCIMSHDCVLMVLRNLKNNLWKCLMGTNGALVGLNDPDEPAPPGASNHAMTWRLFQLSLGLLVPS